jgi:leucyl/phenylalanyl-tRNA--protein transferase
MPVFRLTDALLFPSPDFAEDDGLLAVGGDLRPERLIMAYSHGIFPWYSEGDPILWWSPAPRLVLFPEEFHLPRRLKRTMTTNTFTVTADTAFAEVIAGCATASGRECHGTWITAEMQQAYIELHRFGYAHSVECWHNGQLAGGLYGVCLDRIFFGESMFTRITDASKVALAMLVHLALEHGIALIDCQMTTAHLLRFGARELSREAFQAELDTHIHECLPQKKWCLPARPTGPANTIQEREQQIAAGTASTTDRNTLKE